GACSAAPVVRIKPRWKRAFRSSSAGSWQHCENIGSSPWRRPIRPSANYSDASTSDRSANAREAAPPCSHNWTDRHCIPCLPRVYEFGEWKKIRVNIDYHVEVERHYYSVPYSLAHQEVEVRLTAEMIEVLHRGIRVTSDVRS